MAELQTLRPLHFVPPPTPSLPTLRQRVLRMALVWVVFGVIVGATSSPGSGLIATSSGIIAGVICLFGLGGFLGLIGGETQPAVLGAICGALVGGMCGVAGADTVFYQLNLGLIVGGMGGAGFPILVRAPGLRRLRRANS